MPEARGRTAPTSELKMVVVNYAQLESFSLASVQNPLSNGTEPTSNLIDMLKHSLRLPKHCFQFKYVEFHSKQTFNAGRAY